MKAAPTFSSNRKARLIYFFHGESQAVIFLHGFIKTTRTTPANDIKLAEKRRKEFS